MKKLESFPGAARESFLHVQPERGKLKQKVLKRGTTDENQRSDCSRRQG